MPCSERLSKELVMTILPLFNDFESFRSQVKARLDTLNPAGEYTLNSQEVVIPAFIAAYTGESPETVGISPFPKLPIPNWSLNYRGLSKLEGLSNIFSTFILSHSDSSRYDVVISLILLCTHSDSL